MPPRGRPSRSWRSLIRPSGRRRTAAQSLAAALIALSIGAPAAVAANPSSYSALGDSYTAAPFVPDATGTTLRCQRSTNNYPSIVARTLGVGFFEDESCSGAVAGNMTIAPSSVGGLPSPEVPQFVALRPEVELVTLGIGYNDIGLGPLLNHCLATGLLAPTGTACRNFYAPGGSDSMPATIDATAPAIAGVLKGIRERSPKARTIVVGYPGFLPSNGGNCWPLLSLSPDDVRYVDGVVIALNKMLADTAQANDAEFADTYANGVGHDMCQGVGTKWWEAVVPTSLAAPLHPNALGARGMAESVLKVIEQPRPGPVLSALRAIKRNLRLRHRARFSYRLNRAAPVTATLRREVAGRRVGKRCRALSAGNRRRKPCSRFSGVLRTVKADGSIGDNSLLLGASAMRKPALYRLTASAATGDSRGTPQAVSFRVRR